MNPIYFTDTMDKKGVALMPEMDPAAQQRLLKALKHPDYRFQKLVGNMLQAAHLPYSARKSEAQNTIIGMHGLTFSVCEQMEFGYGIFSGFTDDEYLMTWLDPVFMFQQAELKFKLFNWTDYLKNVGQRGSSSTWGCSVGSYSDVPVQGCEFDYCFEPDRHNRYGVPAGVLPSDVVQPCISQPVVNILGTRITNRVQLREYALLFGMRLQMIDQMFDGDYCASDVGNNGQEDGIYKWFDNFPTRHSYLSQTCLDAFSPNTDNVPTTAAALSSALGYTVPDTASDIAQGKMEYVVRQVSQHIIDLEWKLKDIDGGSTIDFSQIGVIMHPADAQCMVWYQYCQAKCSGTVFQVNSFQEIQAWYRDFQTRLHGGLYGAGVMRLHDGREISLMTFRRAHRGTVLVLVKGWGGSRPNPYAFRPAAMQYNEWWSDVQSTNPSASLQYRLILNGTGVRFEPTNFCTDIEVRWNQRLFSNAPWMQLKIIGMPECSDVSIPTWPALPALTTFTSCAPVGCLSVELPT